MLSPDRAFSICGAVAALSWLGLAAMQGVPAIALAGSWLLPPTVALVLAGVAAVGQTWLTLALFRRTVAGRPLPGYFAILA